MSPVEAIYVVFTVGFIVGTVIGFIIGKMDMEP